jgi:plastocyanin
VLITTNSSGAFTFSPTSITITPGTMVVWKNMTVAPHTSTGDTGIWNGMIQPGATFSFKFTQAGTFTYHCNIHPYMMASITVS